MRAAWHWGVALCAIACTSDRADYPPATNSSPDAAEDDELDAGTDASVIPVDYGPRCFGFDPDGVWLMGEAVDRDSTANSNDFAAVLSPVDLDVHCQNFETSSAPRIRPDGRLIYLADWRVSRRFELRLFVPDDIDPESGVRTRHADQVVPTPACDEPEGRGVQRFVLDPRDGAAYYTCEYDDDTPGEHPPRYYDSEGDVFYEGPNLLAVGYRGDLLIGYLGVAPDDLELKPAVRDEEPPPIEWPEAIVDSKPVAVRTHESGFWIAFVHDGPEDVANTRRDAYLVRLRRDGNTAIVTHYPELEGVEDHSVPRDFAIDAAGNLYEVRSHSGYEPRDQVVRRHLDGSPTEVLWDETQQPDGGLPLYVGDRSYFATGP